MTETNMRQALNIARRRQYRVWFGRWFDGKNVAQQCRQAAERGYTSLVIYDRKDLVTASPQGRYLQKRFEDDQFVPLLQAQLPSLDVTRCIGVQTYPTLFGHSTREYNQVVIDWSER